MASSRSKQGRRRGAHSEVLTRSTRSYQNTQAKIPINTSITIIITIITTIITTIM